MYNQTLNHERKHFCCYSLQSFTTAKILEKHNDCFKKNGKQIIKMAKKGENVKFKNYTRNIKSVFIFMLIWKVF